MEDHVLYNNNRKECILSLTLDDENTIGTSACAYDDSGPTTPRSVDFLASDVGDTRLRCSSGDIDTITVNTTGNTDAKKSAKNRAKKARKKNKSRTVLVSFGPAEVIEFTLELGVTVVPASGSHPLGLGYPISTRVFPTLDEYEATLKGYEKRPIAIEELKTLSFASGLSKDKTPIPARATSCDVYPNELASTANNALRSRSNSSCHSSYPALSEAERVQLFCLSHLTPTAQTAIGVVGSTTPHHHQHVLSEVNKDLRTIREGRNATGCTCRKIKIDKLSTGKVAI